MPFKKGKSGNPKGTQQMPLEVRQAKALSQLEFTILVNQFLGMTREQLQKVQDDPRLTALDLMVLSIIKKAILGGDTLRLNFLLDRIIGKVPTQVNATIEKVDVQNMSDEELVKQLKEKIAVLEHK